MKPKLPEKYEITMATIKEQWHKKNIRRSDNSWWYSDNEELVPDLTESVNQIIDVLANLEERLRSLESK